jgi:hypothetical protein
VDANRLSSERIQMISRREGNGRQVVQTILVQMAGQAEIFTIDWETLQIEQDGIPGGERSGIF